MMRRIGLFTISCIFTLCMCGATFAHMLNPQMPDPTGWGLKAEDEIGLADDWQCVETGHIAGIEFWGSWKQDTVGSTSNVYLGIYENDTSGPFNKPASSAVWSRTFTSQDYTVQLHDGSADQGWFMPGPELYTENDHEQIWRYSISDISDPFYQEAGNIYWLSIGTDYEGGIWGLSTSADHFGSAGVFADFLTGQWGQLLDPINQQSLDLAFVVTPEPATVVLLGLGTIGLLRRKRR